MSEKQKQKRWMLVRFHTITGQSLGNAFVETDATTPEEARAFLESLPYFPGERGEFGTQFAMKDVPVDVIEAYGFDALPLDSQRGRLLSETEAIEYVFRQLEISAHVHVRMNEDKAIIKDLAKLPHRYQPEETQIAIIFGVDITPRQAEAVRRAWVGPTGTGAIDRYRAVVA